LKKEFLPEVQKVIWAETAEEALDEIGKICEAKKCKTLVKSKSMDYRRNSFEPLS
jgi:L-lactate utilization protein LutB